MWNPIHPVKHFFSKIHNLIRWFPVIWNDRNFDYYYLLYIMKKKMEFMRINFIEEHEQGWIDNADRITELTDVLEHLDRVIDDDYLHEEWDELHKEMGEPRFEKTEDGKYYRMVYDETDEEQTRHNEKIRELSAKEDKMRNDDIAYVCDTLKDKIFGWWS